MNEVYYRLPETSEHYHMWGEAEKLHDIANLTSGPWSSKNSEEHAVVAFH